MISQFPLTHNSHNLLFSQFISMLIVLFFDKYLSNFFRLWSTETLIRKSKLLYISNCMLLLWEMNTAKIPSGVHRLSWWSFKPYSLTILIQLQGNATGYPRTPLGWGLPFNCHFWNNVAEMKNMKCKKINRLTKQGGLSYILTRNSIINWFHKFL